MAISSGANTTSGTWQEGAGTVGTRVIAKRYPAVRGLDAGITKHHIDSVDYDEDIHG